MSKSHVLYAVAILFATFFALQFYLIHNVTKQREQFYQQVARKVARDNVNDFVSACQLAASPVFLADMDILSAIMSNGTASAGDCRYLCTSQLVTVFAVDAKLWNNEESIVQQLESEGFSVWRAEQADPWRAGGGQRSSLRTHVSAQRSGHTVHLVVLHPQQAAGGLWWYGPCTDCPHAYLLSPANQHWLQHEGVMDVVELLKVTVDKIPLRAPRYPRTFTQQLPQSRFLHCNTSRAALFRQRQARGGAGGEEGAKEDEEEEGLGFQHDARDLLREAGAVLTRLGVRYWLSSGTCLGWFRQCDIIPYSRDVDLGIWIQDYNPKLIPSMKEAGLPLKHRFGKESDSFELSFYSEERDIKLDIFFFYEDEHYMWNGGTQAKSGKKFKYLFPKFSLCWTLLLGLKVRVPCDTEAYVKANYGPNWFEPVKEWDWKKSPPNVWENGAWPREEWPEVIQTF